ncbi:hypothetical protein ACQEU3_22050 [Spirillospora sp. CA-253888]
MVKPPHEAMHQIFRNDDLLITSALQCMVGADIQKVRLLEELPGDVSTLPLEGRVDSVLLADIDAAPCVLAVEAQSRPDKDKETQWPYYVAYLLAKYRRPNALIVVTNEVSTARWARRTLTVKIPGLPTTMSVTPVVYGPDNVPLVSDLDQARANVAFAAFAAILHGKSPETADILETLENALNGVDIKTARRLVELTTAGLINPKAQEKWSELMSAQTYPFEHGIKAEWKSEGRAEGRAEGEAQSLLVVLEARGVRLSDANRERITSCTDEEQMRVWLTRAANATTEDELFA